MSDPDHCGQFADRLAVAQDSGEQTGERLEGVKTYTLLGKDGRPFQSSIPGTLGGHRRTKNYGRLDCPTALRWIAKDKYVEHRVFFLDEEASIAAGYRPCANCLPRRYLEWRAAHQS